MEAQILRLLKKTKFPLDKRRSVRKSASDPKEGFVLGRVTQYGVGYRMSVMSKKHGTLASLLNAWMARKHPQFNYTAIQVNRGGSGLHVDQGNCGLSVIKAFGDFSGGELWTLQTPYKLHNVKRRALRMDGTVPHMTMPFAGERFSIVCFTTRGMHQEMPPAERLLYRQLGFPRVRKPRDCAPAEKHRLEEASEVLTTHFALSEKEIGDYTNVSIPPRRT
jgi:hypothetical protein